MKLFKSLLLASAAGMVAVSGASAADLGAKKPSPVEYVKACYNPLWGTSGGFVIPGTQTCLRVGGQARFDIGYGQAFGRNNSVMGYRGGGTIFLDAITPSEYGNVRAYVSTTQLYRTGGQRTGTGARWGQSIDAGLANFGGQAGTDFSGSAGFIQFAGFTFGRTSSFFSTVGYAPSILGPQLAPGAGNLNQLAYTAQLGNGFLATIAIEDPTTRRQGIATVNALGNSITGVTAESGNRMPNVVAALRLDQAWGSAELSGIVSEIRPAALTAGLPLGTGYASTKYGFSIAGGVKINAPFVSAGDAFFLQGIYSSGMINSIVGNQFYGSLIPGGNVGGVALNTVDATVNPFTGGLSTTTAWAVNAGFQHFWAPTFSTSITGSYGEINHGNLNTGVGDYKLWTVGLLNTWTPVRGLAIALDLQYINLDPKGRVVDINRQVGATGLVPAGPTQFTKSSDGAFAARFRVTRDF
jgi:hypothetical protein